MYPVLENEPVYVLKVPQKDEQDELNSIMGKAFLAVAGVEGPLAKPTDGYRDWVGSEINVPAGVAPGDFLASLPLEQRLRIGDEISKRFTVLGGKMVIQAAAGPIKAEYEALGVDTRKVQNRYIINTGAIMLLIALISAVCIVGVGFLASRTAAGLARDLRKVLFTKVESFSKAELDKFSTASLITRTTNDITQIQMVTVIMIRMLFYAPIMGVGGVIKALGKSPSMSWIIAVAVALLLILIIAVFAATLPKFRIIQKLVDKLNLVTRENLSGMMVIRAFNTHSFEENRFDKANRDLTNTNLFVNRVMVTMFPVMMLIMNGVTLLIVWVGAHQIANSSMQVGDMMAFMQYAMLILFSFVMMSFMFIMIPRASVAAQRIAEVLETEPEITDPAAPKEFVAKLGGVVEFKNVFFRYHGAGEDMLKDITFKALPGQTTAIIGSTGSGKTTLVNLIPRFYDVTGGQVLVDGVDVREVSQYKLRDKIGYVPQKSSLFSGTIETNLKFSHGDAGEEDILEALEVSQAMDFVNEKPEGIRREISQGGANVSGGQKQRLSIARALMKKPPIYIFDDSFSALDFKTDVRLRKALNEKTKRSTIIIVAQRVSTIMKAEQIIVLDKGRIVGTGNHNTLMSNCQAYQEIVNSQLSREDLA